MEYDEVPAGPGAGGAGGGQACTGPEQCVDQDDCTDDLCEDGECAHPNAADQSPCEDGDGNTGVCVEGVCTIGCDSENETIVCDDHNACTDDTCNLTTNECVNSPIPDSEAPGAEQIPGDCALTLCVSGEEQQIIDDTDLPDDDNECTDDQCNQGVVTNEPIPLGTACTDPNEPNAAFCDDQGACVECNGPSDCSDLPADDECQTRTCTAGACGQDFTSASTPVTAQQLGDCQEVVCDGSGGTQSNDDNGDVPVDNNDCTQDLCSSGTPSNPNEAANTACGSQGTLYCDGQGTCAGCTTSNQCPTDVFCRDHFCNQNTQNCDYNDTANNTALPSQDQTTGDCQELQCNGSGGIKSVAVNDPFLDGNDCTADTCSNGSPVNSARPVNYSCSQNGGTYCDGNSSCVECNSANQCPSAPDCQFEICGSNSCGTGNESNATPAPLAYQTSGDCNTRVCDGNGGVNGDVPANDPFNDGNECTSDLCNNGVVSNPPVANGTVCTSNNQYCDGVEECQSGTCTGAGDPCPGPDGDADCIESCSETNNDCNANDPNGAKCDAGSGSSSGECTNGSCDMICGYIPAGTGGTCPGVCNGGCAGDECTILCVGEQACRDQHINCPPGWLCRVDCVGKEACQKVHLACPLDYQCHVLCSDERACRDIDIQCGTFGPCILECGSGNQPCYNADQTCGYNLCHAMCTSTPSPNTNCGPSCDCMPCP
ncbi:MAG: hypothetical protein JRI68_10535 [Deltaproteobacteria bacterium]|nr:hypothetical protein [Deltaproteobacteria bacterium]